MLDIIIKENLGKPDRDLLHQILANQHFIISQNSKIMSAATDLQALVDQLTGSQATLKTALDAQKASLDSIKSSIGIIVDGLPKGGMTADEVEALKTSITTALGTEQANATEAADNAADASDDAAALTAALPAAPPADGGTPPTEEAQP